MATESIPAQLSAYADKLRKTHLFVGTGDDAISIDKQYIFLTLAGVKPVSEVGSGHWEPTPTGRISVADSMEEVSDFLTSLGLFFKLTLYKGYVLADIARSDELLEEYMAASETNDTVTIGRLHGFPLTAVNAFVNGTSLDIRKQDELKPKHMGFRLSPDHYEEEAAVAEEWQKILKEYGLVA
jgi:hypothetical protein